MSLKIRLLVTMVGMVVLTVIMVSVMELNSLVAEGIAHATERSDTTANFVKSWILHRVNEMPMPQGAQSATAVRQLWRDSIERDAELPAVLSGILAQTKSVVEISIADQRSRIIVSSNMYRVGAMMPERLTLKVIQNLSPLDRLIAVLSGRVDYETRVKLGTDDAHQVFVIQVLVSTVLLREAIVPALQRTALASMIALLIAAVLAYGAAQVSLRPLAYLSETIDQISRGEIVVVDAQRSGGTREFQVVEQKLLLLGEQYRGAQEGAFELRSSMERRLTAINRLTGGVAHEIKNPLNSIAIRMELLKNRVLEDVPEAREEIEIITQEINRLDRVVRTFLDFTRPVEVETRELDLGGITSDIITLIKPEAETQNVKIDWTPPETKISVRGDSDLLKQAILNVCRNALDVMREGGTLTVNLTRQKSDAILTIDDTGPGIPVAQREKIFQLYYTTKSAGSGIGLAMTFRAVQLHGGSIEVGGEEGRGATFRLRLPAQSRA
jgi:signal transduction histidine kinase